MLLCLNDFPFSFFATFIRWILINVVFCNWIQGLETYKKHLCPSDGAWIVRGTQQPRIRPPPLHHKLTRGRFERSLRIDRFGEACFSPTPLATATKESPAPDTGLSPNQLQMALVTLGPATLRLFISPYHGCGFVLSSITPIAFQRSFSPSLQAHLELSLHCLVPWEAGVIAAHPSHCRFKDLELCQCIHLWSSVLFG